VRAAESTDVDLHLLNSFSLTRRLSGESKIAPNKWTTSTGTLDDPHREVPARPIVVTRYGATFADQVPHP